MNPQLLLTATLPEISERSERISCCTRGEIMITINIFNKKIIGNAKILLPSKKFVDTLQ